MRKNYDFSGGKRGAVITSPGKTRITIRIDNGTLEWFRERADEQGGGSYQSLINAALREYITSEDENLEEILRRVIREEIPIRSRSK